MSLLYDDIESDGDEFEGVGFNSEESGDDTVFIRRRDVRDFNPGNILPEPAAVTTIANKSALTSYHLRIFRLLRTALSHLPKAYILVDALGEMDQESLESLLQHFYELSQWHPLEVKLVMTSRPVAVVEKIARAVKVLDIRLDKQRVESDIAAYIQHRLSSSSIPPGSRSHVAKTIMGRCDAYFYMRGWRWTMSWGGPSRTFSQ
ncbi:hypothetical protein B0T10DRAFT_464535 [Thelonectria olida]|uniref:NACHT domain-containing protein n=1 Tax=Thelonectria olida TaxID=1576542 RepID=A0A9P8VVV7_9HYPO|nr:hypothetical protein B0T10DRAFT_464535 [Thelonectria olida]